MSQFRVEPETFPPAGDALDQAAQQLLERWQALRERSLAVQFGQYDVVAPLIQASLHSAVAIADECFSSVAEATGVFSDGVRATGEIYRQAELDTVSTVQQQQA